MSEDVSERVQQELKEQVQIKQQILMLENIAKRYLTRDAIERYGTLKSAHPEIAVRAIAIIAQAAQQGEIKEIITDDMFKTILKQIQTPKRDIKITRK